MPRYFVVLLLCGLSVTGRAQEPKPEKQPASDLGGSTENATLALNPLGHVDAIQGLFFTPDGKQLVSVGLDKTIQFWDIASGERVRVLRLPLAPTAAALAPDGRTLALGRWASKGRRVLLVNLDDGRVLWLSGGNNLTGFVSALAFSPDGDRLAVAHQGVNAHGVFFLDGLKGIWEKKPEEVAKIQGRGFLTVFYVRALAFSPDGQRIVLGCAFGDRRKTAYLLDVPVGDAKVGPALPLPVGDTIRAVAWSLDGQQVATVDAKIGPTVVQVWSAAERVEQRRYSLGRPRDGAGLHFLSAEELLVTWSYDGSDRKSPVGQGQSVLSLAGAITERKGSFIRGPAMDNSRSAVFIDRTATKKGAPTLAAFSSGRLSEEIVIWEVATGKQLHHLGGKLGTPQTVGWSKDGKSLGFYAIDEDKKPYFREALDLQALELRGKVDRGDYLYKHRTTGEWSVHLVKGTDLEIRHGDKKVLMRDDGTHIRVWALSPAQEPTWVAWGSQGGSLGLSDPRTGKVLVQRLSFGQPVTDIAPSPDGRFLAATGSRQQVAFIYRIADDPAKTDRQPVLHLFLSHGDWILWTKEGYYAASPGGERLMGWTVDNDPNRLPTFHPADRFRKRLYRPDVVKWLLEKGNLKDALEVANAALKQEGTIVAEGTADLEKLLPPKVSLQIVDKQDLPRLKVKAAAQAAVKDQPVTALRLLVDGRVLADGPSALFATGKDKAEVEWTITLPPGKHTVAVLARSPDASSTSEPVEVIFVNKADQPVLHILAIGVNDYEEKSLRLEFAAKDANDLFDSFQKACKGELFRDVVGQPLLNAKARRGTVLQELAALRKRVKPNDLVVVYFAGHGVKEKDKFYLLTVEAKIDDLAKTSISGDDLRKSLSEFPCQVLLILDACHSSGGVKNFRPAVDDVTRTLTDDECGVAVLCAAMAHEKALEKQGNGLFTRAVVEALQGGSGVPRHPRSGRLFLHHLHSFVFDRVSDESSDRQHPFLSLPWVVESFPVAQFSGK